VIADHEDEGRLATAPTRFAVGGSSRGTVCCVPQCGSPRRSLRRDRERSANGGLAVVRE